MSFNRDERPIYAIGIIIDNSVTGNNGVKVQNIVDTVKNSADNNAYIIHIILNYI